VRGKGFAWVVQLGGTKEGILLCSIPFHVQVTPCRQAGARKPYAGSKILGGFQSLLVLPPLAHLLQKSKSQVVSVGLGQLGIGDPQGLETKRVPRCLIRV